VLETWTGEQAAWGMARGYEGQFGHALNAPYVWIPLSALFFFVLFDWRRPARWAHLDLLALLSFGASHAFFNDAEIGVSVPLAYPPLLYLLARTLWVGFRGGEGLRPRVPTVALAVLCLLLVAFRITLNVVDSGVIDVGYAGVIGADRLVEGEPIWGEGAFPPDNHRGDTYGPANYVAYVPFEQIWPWNGGWDALPAAHAAAISFDLAALIGLFALGLRLRRGDRGAGVRTGLVLAFAWLAYPYTTFALQSNSNDALVGALIIWGLVAWSYPAARGALLACAGMVKFAPLALAPLFVAGGRGLRERLHQPGLGALAGPALAALAFVAVTLALLLIPASEPGLATFWERTVENQFDRSSPFSVWGQLDWPEWPQRAVLAAGALLALAVAFVPARRTPAQAAALAAAVLIALQLAVDHWFYLYIPWFCGLVFAGLAGASSAPASVPVEGGERRPAG
ncbi:MAG TPA: glycosyltransferase 87 family protein, partial [Myxococcota bacterium]